MKPASITCFYWTGFSEQSYNPVLSVLEHEDEYSKTAVFRLGYTYSWRYSKTSQSYKHGEKESMLTSTINSHMLFKTNLPTKGLLALSFPAILSKQSFQLDKILPNASSWAGKFSGAQNKGTTTERLPPESVSWVQSSKSFKTTRGSSACVFTWKQLGASCYAISFRSEMVAKEIDIYTFT